ncbi:MAG: phosphatidate cytidylyltransferase [Caldilineae bacterium]|nr:MAG: phosphatidate cytidylyltransferase [Caldilineae bacterium]
MLRERVLVAVVLVPIVAAVAWLGGWWFTAFVALAALLAAWELFALLGKNEFLQPVAVLGLIIVGWLVLESGLPPKPERFQILLVLSVLVGLVVALFLRQPHAASDWILTLGGAVYLGLTMRFLAMLRGLPDGLGWVALAALVTWITDSGAYFIGRAWGRHKLWPRVSPKKTWEGLVGGLAVGTPSAALLALFLVPGLTWWQGVIIGLAVGTLGPFGDLSESLFKRQVGVKDSSHLLPGHGGAFDRIDSFIFVGPVIYMLARLFGW